MIPCPRCEIESVVRLVLRDERERPKGLWLVCTTWRETAEAHCGYQMVLSVADLA